MLIAQLEEKVVAALSAVLTETVTSFRIFGSWNPAAAFAVKNEEDEKAVAQVGVALSTFSRPTFTAPQLTTAGAINLAVRFELDATGARFLAAAEAIDNLLQAWQSDAYQGLFDALDIEGVGGDKILSVDEIAIETAVPRIDEATHTVNITFPFTLHGTTN